MRAWALGLFLTANVFLTVEAMALIPIQFGPEFTFCRDFEKGEYEVVFGRMKQHLIHDQPEGAKFTQHYGRLISPNGWHLSVIVDSNCVEVQTNPMTVEQFKFYKGDIQDAIFASAASVEYFPALWQGGGHINIDIANFKENPLLFRNFIVDLLNHNELFMGIFEYNMNCCSFPHELYGGSRPRLAVHAVNRLFRQGQPTFRDIVKLFEYQLKGRSFNLSKIFLGDRLEIRAVRPQASMDVWIRQIELFQARIQYLEKIETLIPYRPRVPWHYDPQDKDTPPVDPQAALQSFYVYVTEAGQKWQDHTDYLWPQWISGGEVQKFEASEWFKNQEQKRDCQKNLAESA